MRRLCGALSATGDHAGAIAILEPLSAQYPNDGEILRLMGDAYVAQGDQTMGAFFLGEAYKQSPEDIELLYQAYRAQEAANDHASALNLLDSLSEMDPASMTDALWIRLGELRAEAGRNEPALQAYLKGVNPDKTEPSPKTSAAIGELFINLNNLPLAERWFKLAADSNDPNALTALFGLLEINLRNKNWTAAEANIAQLDAQFPGALDASEWSQARGELKRWRDAQEKMKAELAKAQQAKQAAEVTAVTVVDVPAENSEAETETATETASPSEGSQAKSTEGKAQIIEDMDRAEAMADAPAIEVDNEAINEDKTIAFDPNIAIEPAEPDTGIGVSFDQQNQGATVNITNSNETVSTPATGTTIEPTPLASRPAPRVYTIEELLADAEAESMELNHKAAIRSYWQALGINNQRADIWSSLSKAYQADGQMKNAETTALEATRLEPGELKYALEYLRVVQSTKNATDFLAELEAVYARFPRSPEVTLSLARAYDRIARNPVAASTYYSRFIELAPNHPLRSEAEAALRNR